MTKETDRELLELAAKAAGISPLCFDATRHAFKLGNDRPEFCKRDWNPLTDDGDALRLAVKLQLVVYNDHLSSGCAYCTRGEDEVFPEVESGTTSDSEVLPEDYAATRRAIVLAAAEVGKGMLTQDEFMKMFPGLFPDAEINKDEQ